MNDILQVAMAGLVVAGYIVLWRIDSSTRSGLRIQQAARRNAAEHKRTVAHLKQRNTDWGQLNQARNELNARYSETINKMRAHHGIEVAGPNELITNR
jgi:hypothetical protein